MLSAVISGCRARSAELQTSRPELYMMSGFSGRCPTGWHRVHRSLSRRDCDGEASGLSSGAVVDWRRRPSPTRKNFSSLSV